MELMFWPLQGDPRLVAMPDAAFRKQQRQILTARNGYFHG